MHIQFGVILIWMNRANQLLNMIVIVVVLTTIISITIFNNQTTTGSSDDSRPILPKYREGYEVGKVQDGRITWAEKNMMIDVLQKTLLFYGV